MRRGFALLLLVILSFSLIACNLNQTDRDYVEFNDSKITVEIYSSEPDWDSLYSVYDNEGESNTIIALDIDQSELDLNTTGIYQVLFTFEFADRTETHTLIVEVVDSNEYTITLLGEQEVFLMVHSNYIDKGLRIRDYKNDGVEYETISSVNVNHIGTYEIRYKVKDEFINIIRTVHVVDQEAPEITLLGEDVIFILKDAIYSDPGFTIEDNYLHGSITITMTEIDTSIPGEYQIQIQATDQSENLSEILYRTVHVLDDPTLNMMLHGDDIIHLNVGDPYLEQGAWALTDEGITEITAKNTLNRSLLGEQTILYEYIYQGITYTITRKIILLDTVPPVVVIRDKTISTLQNEVDWTSFVDSVYDNFSTNLSIEVVEDNIEYGTPGEYTVTIKVMDSSHNETITTFIVKVEDMGHVYPTGFYNLKFMESDIRTYFMSRAERYLLDTMAGGVPVYTNATLMMYSDRLAPNLNKYIPVLGYNAKESFFSFDDSHVTMLDGEIGEEGEYTYRLALSNSPATYNQWMYDTSIDKEYLEYVFDSLYRYTTNETNDGIALVPSMASMNPIPVDGHSSDSKVEVSSIWQIPLKEGLKWYYHSSLQGTENLDDDITAEDFVDTYKLAIDSNWFRAISGGAGFVNSMQTVIGIRDYMDGTGSWEDVGIKVVDDYTIEFEFVEEMSEFNVRYWLTSFVMTPIHTELYEMYPSQYGFDMAHTAYSGYYSFESHDQGNNIYYLSENIGHHLSDVYHYTGIEIQVIEDVSVRFQLFLDGKLEAASIPSDQIDNYYFYPGTKVIPGATTYKIMINGFGTEENLHEVFPESTYVPEPILGNINFKKAMYFAIDREDLTGNYLRQSIPAMYLFSDTYIVDLQGGIPYRETVYGKAVGEGYSTETFGFDLLKAKYLFDKALDESIENGYYEPGTEFNPTKIRLELLIFSGSASQQLFGDFIERTFEEIFVDEERHIYIDVVVVPTDFPAIYYDKMMIGEFDLSIGGISGSTSDAASFLDTFSSDNRSGFLLNWGIDTSIAEIELDYFDSDGILRSEIWSFDAIASALNGEVYISEGKEDTGPEVTNFTVTPTTASFHITKFNSDEYSNFTYTLYSYDFLNGYKEVEGYINIPITTSNVLIEGLTPSLQSSDPTMYYIGDYELHIEYEYVLDRSKTGVTIPDWWIQPSALTYTITSATTNSVSFDVSFANGYANIFGAILKDSQGNDYAGSIEMLNSPSITVSGLQPNATYYIEFIMDDGSLALVEVQTASE